MFEPLHFIADIPQDQIAACPTITGMAPEWLPDLPPAVAAAVDAMPWTNERKHAQLLIRPQDCRDHDTRLGTFWHRDVDVHGVVTKTWDDMILTIVSFGGVAETEFIRGVVPERSAEPPHLSCYTDALAQSVNGYVCGWEVSAVAPCQVVRYGSLDWHRAGHIRKRGWRLVMIGIESDHLEPRGGIA